MDPTKILVVEDDEESRRILVLRLQWMGKFTVREATTGQEALDWIARDRPDVVLLDLKLPVMDGLEVARRVRTMPAPLSQLPIIAVTAHVMAWNKDTALAAGCDEYITKPIVDPGEIGDKVERLLSHGRPTRPAGEVLTGQGRGSS